MVYQAVKLARGNGSSRIQRKFSILSVLYDERYVLPHQEFSGWIPDGSSFKKYRGEWAGWLTTGDVARQLGLTSSAHLRGLLAELKADSFVLMQTKPYRANVHAHMWMIADNARHSATWARAFDAYLHGLKDPTIESNMGES